jgi:hypothetical protein
VFAGLEREERHPLVVGLVLDGPNPDGLRLLESEEVDDADLPAASTVAS